MEIAYIAHTRFPTEKAHGHQIARVCEALTSMGNTVTLVSPDIHNEIKNDYKEYYSLQTPFVLKRLPTKDALLSPLIPGMFAMLFTMRSYRKALRTFFAEQKFDLLYARSPHVLGPMLRSNIPVILELHTLPRRGRKSFISQCKKCALVVCLTSPMKKELVEWGVPESHILVEGDAVDLGRFTTINTNRFSLPPNRPVLGYIGSLRTMDNVDKGVDVLLRAMPALKQLHNACALIVGGPDSLVHAYKDLAHSLGLSDEDVHFEGRVEAGDVPSAISACDICVYPAPKSSHPFFLRDTSPLKLYEYLAAGKPVACANIPPVHDMVDETVVEFFEPGDEADLTRAVAYILDHPEKATQMQSVGKEIVVHHTWEKRMERIIASVEL